MQTLIVLVVAALASAASVLAFPNTAPLAAGQWYLAQDQAWTYWPTRPSLAAVKVAVIDSGIDASAPEFAGRIAGGRSFVSGSWMHDTDGHGTFVAGLIAADPSGGQGIAGMAFNARLLVAKVVRPDGSVSLAGEVRAIRWAANAGARVINLSLGGLRDPLDPALDTYSRAEEDAVEYAYAKGAVVVAAVGNGTSAPTTPWPFADWPAALPHVIGVSALRQDGSVPDFSNRDPVYVDIAAPGVGILSTIPRNLVNATEPGCAGVPYSNCGPAEFRDAIGTSFAAPQVSAAAALLLGQDPRLTADEVGWLLERSARDVNASTGCTFCPPGRDALTGWGRLDVQAALTLLARHPRFPRPDPYEPNVDAGSLAHRIQPPRTLVSSLDFWDDPIDVYVMHLERGEQLDVRVSGSESNAIGLTLWKPGTETVVSPRAAPSNRIVSAGTARGRGQLSYVVGKSGDYYVEVDYLPPARPRLSYTLVVSARPTHG